jgi:hypothetical protein
MGDRCKRGSLVLVVLVCSCMLDAGAFKGEQPGARRVPCGESRSNPPQQLFAISRAGDVREFTIHDD